MSRGRPPSRVRVRTPSAAYEVLIGGGLLERLGRLTPVGEPVFVLADRGVPRAKVRSVAKSLRDSGRRVAILSLAPTEKAKSLVTLERVLRAMARSRLERGSLVVGLGGGVVTDVAGFAAAVYQRGVPVVQAPTTLLGMVDAAIGGKTAVNLRVGRHLRKNLVGAFHHPRLVVADVGVLASLPPREFACGLAECIKHAMLGETVGGPGRGLLEWTETNLGNVVERRPEALAELVRRNVAVKAKVVEADEREEHAESDLARAILNLGHTFGHAMETASGVRPVGANGRAAQVKGLKHGEAVGLGLMAATASAEAMGLVGPGLRPRVEDMLRRAGLPTRAAGLPTDAELRARMLGDKKVRGGRLRLVLPMGPGRVRLVEDPPTGAVDAGWRAIRAG